MNYQSQQFFPVSLLSSNRPLPVIASVEIEVNPHFIRTDFKHRRQAFDVDVSIEIGRPIPSKRITSAGRNNARTSRSYRCVL